MITGTKVSTTNRDSGGGTLFNYQKWYTFTLPLTSVCEDDGGIEIYIAARKPAGIPGENWLPINRENKDLDVILRVYLTNLGKMMTWNKPKAALLKRINE